MYAHTFEPVHADPALTMSIVRKASANFVISPLLMEERIFLRYHHGGGLLRVCKLLTKGRRTLVRLRLLAII